MSPLPGSAGGLALRRADQAGRPGCLMEDSGLTAAAQEFLAGVPGPRRDLVETVHHTIAGAAPELEQWIWRGKMWGGTDQTILGYGHFEHVNASKEAMPWFLIGLASQKAHVSLYVNAVRDGRYLGQVYADRLGKVKLGSASIGFKKLGDLNLDAIAEMVKEAAG